MLERDAWDRVVLAGDVLDRVVLGRGLRAWERGRWPGAGSGQRGGPSCVTGLSLPFQVPYSM